jgi:hypothetical protein
MLKYIAALGIFILLAHYVFTYTGLYVKTGWLDIPMHMLAGMWVGLILTHIVSERTHALDLKANFWITFFIILGTTLIVGVLWEFWEFFFSQLAYKVWPELFSKGTMTLTDTLKDILDDMIGGSVAGMVAFYSRKKL